MSKQHECFLLLRNKKACSFGYEQAFIM